jgi:hypothetical protein
MAVVGATVAMTAGAGARTTAAPGGNAAPRASAAAAGALALPPIKHVFTIILENESESTTFGPGSPAPYLAKTLVSKGAFVPNYYATGHFSNDNYISMISGQAPNTNNQDDCGTFRNFLTTSTGAHGQQEGLGCVYPADIQTIANQLTNAHLTWRSYDQSMGVDPTRDNGTVCAHPPIGSADPTEGGQTSSPFDEYATRHNPFVYFHSIIDNTSMCDADVVNLNALQGDLASASKTPNYVFITPDLCADGHDATCKNPSRPGGFAGIQQFLQKYVPMITNSAAFKQNGLLIVTFDEALPSDTSHCCGEIAGPGAPLPGLTGPGGGKVGAVLISRCIKPATVTQTSYNHYSMLASIENIFGLSHLGMAGVAGLPTFGSNIFNKACEAPPVVKVSAKAKKTKITVKWSSTDAGGPGVAYYTVQERTAGTHPGAWKTLTGLSKTTKTSAVFIGKPGKRYQFEVKATDKSRVASAYVVSKSVTA